MTFSSFISGLLPSTEDVTWYMKVSYGLFGLFWSLAMLNRYTVSMHPVRRRDRKLGSKHKEAEAERLQVLERLNSGSNVVDDSQFGVTLDVEKDPGTCPFLSGDFNEEASLATISLWSGGSTAPSKVREAMKTLSETTASEEFVDENFFCSSHRTRMQTKVELQDGTLDRLKDLVKKIATPSPNEFKPVLQVDSWAVLMPSGDQGVKLLRLPTHQLPVILHAEYAAGLVTITGLNLEDADIYVSAERAIYTVQLSVYRFVKGTEGKGRKFRSWKLFSDTPEDVAILPLRLQWKDTKNVFIYATKKVHLGEDGKTVDVMSKAVHILDSFWNSVIGFWMPIIAFVVLAIYSIRTLLMRNSNDTSYEAFQGTINTWNVIAVLIPATMILSSNQFLNSVGVAEFLKYRTEFLLGSLGRAFLVFYYGFKGLKGPRLEIPYGELVRKVLPATPATASAPPTRHSGLPSGPRAIKNSVEEVNNAKSIADPDWEWPAYDMIEDKYGRSLGPKIRSNHKPGPDQVDPFRAIYRRRKEQVWPDVVQVELNSASLIKIVQKFLPQNGDLQCALEDPTVDGRDLFIVLDDMKNHIEALSTCVDALLEESHEVGEDEGKGKLHLKHLIRFMDKEYGDVSIRLQRMTEEKCVTWDMLWTFLTPGRKVVYNCDYSEEMLAAVVSKNSYSLTKDEWLFSIELDVWDYNGRNYQKCQIQRPIKKFDGERAFSSLAVRPIEMAGVPEVLDQDFLANGKRFYELAMKSSHRFMHYSGPLLKLGANKAGCLEVVKENADGRVMVDLANFVKMNPNNRLGKSFKPRVVSHRKSIDPFSDRQRPSVVENEEGQKVEKFSSGPIQVSDETLIFAPGIVYGFSFTLKEWGAFAISGFSEISFNSNAFDAVVMDPDSKQLVYNLVSQYIATPMGPSRELQAIDHISDKGEGCVFLSYGPPGTGKTLTAESVAESMHRPLWSLSVTELGSSPSTLEKALFKILEVSVTWQAVVLLDEADCFLEKRTFEADLPRNTMAGVFLRFLEYHRGVLFLTTNRIGTLDNAFRSRISMFLHYPKLNIQQRERVWATLLERAGVMGITADFVSEVAAEDLNGREIRNTIHTAQMLAKSTGQTLDETHLRHLTKVLVSSLKTLSENTSEDN